MTLLWYVALWSSPMLRAFLDAYLGVCLAQLRRSVYQLSRRRGATRELNAIAEQQAFGACRSSKTVPWACSVQRPDLADSVEKVRIKHRGRRLSVCV